MQRPLPALIICLYLFFTAIPAFSAAADSVYAKMTLGSAGYKTMLPGSGKYARSQATNLKRLKSIELAERAVRACYSTQASPANNIITAHAQKCTASLRVTKISGDTFALAFGDPQIDNLDAQTYLQKLMQALQEDNMLFAYEANQKSVDSLDKLMDKATLRLLQVEDTLFSFIYIAEFRREAQRILIQLYDTTAAMKSDLLMMGCDSGQVKRMFMQLDTALFYFRLSFADTVSEFWKERNADAGFRVFGYERSLGAIRLSMNATRAVVMDTSVGTEYRERYRTLLVEMLHDQLNNLLSWDDNRRAPYGSDAIPFKGKSFGPVLKRYRKNCSAHQRLAGQRTNLLLQRMLITARAVIVCRPSTTRC